MCVHNYAWTGYPSAFFSDHIPTVVVGQEQADLFDMEPMNIEYMSHAVVAKTTESAMDFAYKTTGTDKVIIFDGAMGGLNCSESLRIFSSQRRRRSAKRWTKFSCPSGSASGAWMSPFLRAWLKNE